MIIKEEDIFKYVLFPNEIEPSKKEYILKNENLFSEQIEFYKYFVEIFSDKEIESQSKKVAERILSKIKVIELLPLANTILPKNNTITLAAATANIANKQSESITYSDENSKYLVRIINNKDKNTLYFFSKNDDKGQKLKITLVPSIHIYHITNSRQQIAIKHEQLIQKILIEQE